MVDNLYIVGPILTMFCVIFMRKISERAPNPRIFVQIIDLKSIAKNTVSRIFRFLIDEGADRRNSVELPFLS
jgi:hypothetical protein